MSNYYNVFRVIKGIYIKELSFAFYFVIYKYYPTICTLDVSETI